VVTPYDKALFDAERELTLNPRAFQHLTVSTCLPNWKEDDPRWHNYTPVVTPSGQYRKTTPSPSVVLSPLIRRKPAPPPVQYAGTPPFGSQGLAALFHPTGVLQIGLLRTEPFCFGEEGTTPSNEIWAKHQRPFKKFSCQNRPRLLEALAQALLSYECALRALKTSPLAVMELLLGQVLDIRQLVLSFLTLRQEEKLPTRVRKLPHHYDTIAKAFDKITSVLCCMTTDDVERMRIINQEDACTTLIHALWDALETHGPARKYSATARRYTIATILIQFGIKTPDTTKPQTEQIHTVAEQLRKSYELT
jgi:hypothetical protein